MAQVSVLNSTGATVTVGHVEDLGQAAMAASLPVVIASNQTAVDVAASAVVPGTGATNLGKAEDAAHTSGDVGVMALAIRNDSFSTTLAGTTGDYSGISVDSTGRLGIGVVNPGTSAPHLGKLEDAAAGAGDTGVFILAVRRDTDGVNSGTTGDYSEFQVDARGLLKTSVNTNAAPTSRSGTITLGATAQQLCAANTVRRGLMIQNLSVENLWVDETTTAVADQPSIKILPGDMYVFDAPGFGAVSIIGATTGSKFTAREW